VYPSVSAAVNRRNGETDLRALMDCRWPRSVRWSMIRKSGYRFSEKIMFK